jgi:hypothetical protein
MSMLEAEHLSILTTSGGSVRWKIPLWRQCRLGYRDTKEIDAYTMAILHQDTCHIIGNGLWRSTGSAAWLAIDLRGMVQVTTCSFDDPQR